ncbi:MAG TPA: chromate efflux transporter [Polyangiaceae bacterium]|nr:chromate efflux transporter [Polyangiaceae bacterium]
MIHLYLSRRAGQESLSEARVTVVVTEPVTPRATSEVPAEIPFASALKVWAKIGLLSFGGPAGQVALMHKELVEERKWIDEERFLHALNYCMLLPGPEAQQLAAYIGWLMHKGRGGLAAGLLFVLPGFVSILVLSMLYAGFRQLAPVAAIFFGLKAAVLALVVEAVIRIGKRALKNRLMVMVAALGFIALFCFAVPFPFVVLSAGAFGFFGSRIAPRFFPEPNKVKTAGAHETVIDHMAAAGQLAHTKPSTARALRVLIVSLVLWATPLIALSLTLGPQSVYLQEGIFFSKAAVVTFGGAYAVLAYIAQKAVETYGWLQPGEMLDGLGLAETTPGPLIMVVQFVGFLGAYRNPGDLPPMLAGVFGSLITVWVTFVPCFLWIFFGAPYIEALRGNRSLHAALSAITAAVVGVILNLSIWFGMHVVFARVTEHSYGPLHLSVPDPSSIDPAAATLAALAMLAMLRFKVGLPKTLIASALLGAAWKLLIDR